MTRNTAAGSPRTPHSSRGSIRCFGAITGYTFKLIRECLRLTQAQLAERLTVDLSTVQGWETGRRPLTSLRTGDFTRLRVWLAALGAPAHLFAVLIESVEADLLVADAVECGPRVSDPQIHPLGAFVHRRNLTNLLTWPLTGIMPSQLRGLQRTAKPHGPVSPHPVLSAEERTRFFDHLLITADAHRHDDHSLLRRQAIYLLSFDDRRSSKEWLLTEQRRAIRSVGHTTHLPTWIAARSSATALARHGDKDPLRAFVDTLLNSPEQELANLTYWAYWVGELDQVHRDDSFMTSASVARHWSGSHLIEHLLDRLEPNSDHADLNIHSLWALLSERPTLLPSSPGLRALVEQRIEVTMDSHDLTARARQELASVAYAVRLADR